MRRKEQAAGGRRTKWAVQKEKLQELCVPSVYNCTNCRYKDCIRPEGGMTSDVKTEQYIRMKDGIPMTEDLRPKKRRQKA